MAIAAYNNQDVMTQLIHFTADSEGDIDAVAQNPTYQEKFFLLPSGLVNYVTRRGIRQVPTWQPISGLNLTAASISYDNINSTLVADDVKEAIDELDAAIQSITGAIDHPALDITVDTVTQEALDFNFATQRLSANLVTPTTAGVLSSADKVKLNSIESSAKDDQIASEVPFTPYLDIISTDVQAAIQEVKDDVDASSHAAVTLNASQETQDAANLVGQELELVLATISTAGLMSSVDKAKLDTTIVASGLQEQLDILTFTSCSC